MLNKYFKYFLLATLILPFFGTSQAPGGVEGSAMWLSVEEEEGAFLFREKRSTVALTAVENMELLNSNPTILFDESTSVQSIDFPATNIDQLQVFTVFEPRDSLLEKGVWYIESDERDELLLTTHRFADFGKGRFMNNLKDQKRQAQLNTYQRFINSKKKNNYRIVFGDNQLKQAIPVTPFLGKFAEFIVFDRVLNNLDKAKVESYLAIKYGLTIDKDLNQSLYNSNDQVIWETKKNSNYSNNIAGVGRDDASGLYQKQSSSVYEDNIFSLAIDEFAEDNNSNPGELYDLQFLIWGSNQESLTQESKKPGLIQKLNRKWQIISHGNIAEETQLLFDVEHLELEKKSEEIFWLVVDQSGSDQFDIYGTKYFPMVNIEASKLAQFDDINWENISEAHFSIALGPKMISVMQVDAPDCSGEANGSLELTARGGQAPYTFELKNESGQIIHSFSRNNSTPFEISNIAAGSYQLEIRDNNGLRYNEDFFINPNEAPSTNLADQYFWNSQEELLLDASAGIDIQADYDWQLPNGEAFSGANISIDQVGTYVLKITTGECIAQKRIAIKSAAPNNFKAIRLFPNPVSDGIFQLDVDLEHSAELEIQLVNITGKVLHKKILNGKISHQYQGYIPEPGMYLVKLISAGSVETRKLIVHQKA